MLNKESDNEIKSENIQRSNESEINLFDIKSFEDLFNLFKSEKYNIRKFSKDLQNFCQESEKKNYVCENNKEFKKSIEYISDICLFKKFNLSKNRFDFQIFMSDLIIELFKFLKNFKPSNKKEYNILQKLFQIFTEIKNNNLLMSDIECLNEYGLFKEYKNNFFMFLFDINEKGVKQLLFFFDLKKYFLSNNNNIDIFIFKFNEFINSNENETKKTLFVAKLEKILSETLNVLNQKNKDENLETNHKIEIYKEKIINSINREKIFELYFNDEMFTSHLSTLFNLFQIFTQDIDKQINIILSKNDKQIKKVIAKFIIKHASFLDNYIDKKTLFLLNDFSIEISFSFYISQYMDGKSRLINIYNMFKDNEKSIHNLVDILRNKLKKEKQAELIEKNIYNLENEYELEEKENMENNKDNYFVLPENYKILYISCEDDNHIKESNIILDDLINNNMCLDEYLGIDTEWRSSPNFLDFYTDNLTDTNINKDLIVKDKSNLSDIIQIAGYTTGFIFDTKSVYKNEEIKKKIAKIFEKNKFIGFNFQNDYRKLGDFFTKIVNKNNFIELADVYYDIKKVKAPELKIITLEMFNKILDKRDQISDWSKRPLLPSQIKYGILDAYVLILIYKKLYEL